MIYLIIFLPIISLYQQTSSSLFDTGAYHLPVSHAISQFGLPRGIANLDPMMGLISPLFYVAAAFEWLFPGHSWQIVNGFVFCVGLFLVLFFLNRQKGEAFTMLVFPAILVLFFNRHYIGTLSPDLLSNLYALLFFIHLYDSEKKNELGHFISVHTPLIILMTWNKLTSVSLVFILIILIFFLVQKKSILFKKIRIPSLILATVIFILWIASNVYASGYPFYPFAHISFPGDWKIPLGRVQGLSQHIFLWGITPNYSLDVDYSGLWWLPQWISRNFRPGLYRSELLILLSSPVLLFFFWKWNRTSWIGHLLPLGFLFHLLIWLYGSPNPRFLSTWTFLILGFFLGSLFNRLFSKRQFNWLLRLTILYLALFTLAESGINSKLIKGSLQNWWIPFSSPKIAFTTFKLEDGNPVNVPQTTKQIWYMPFPNSRQWPVHARGNMEHGFYPSSGADTLETPF